MINHSKRKRNSQILLILLYSLLVSAVILTVIPIRILIRTSQDQLVVYEMREATSNLAQEAYNILMAGSTITRERKFRESALDSINAMRKGDLVLAAYENQEYMAAQTRLVTPILSGLLESLEYLRERDLAGTNLPLTERSSIYRNTGLSEIADIEDYVLLTGIIEELDFYIREISVLQRQILGQLDSEMAERKMNALQIINIAVVLYLLGLGVAVLRFLKRRIDLARIAEGAAKERSEVLEIQVKARTADLEIQNKQLIEAGEMLMEREKMTALGQVVSGVAHEVNTPLGICVTATSFLQDRVNDLENPITIEDTRELVNIIMDNITRASNLIKGFKKVAVDEMDDESRAFDLVSYIVADLLPGLEAMAKEQGNRISYTGPESCAIIGYPGSLAQVVTNLVVNAGIHGYGADSKGVIQIEIRELTESFSIRISDTGRGMPPEVRERLFDPFFTTNRENGGSGLGMMIVYNIVSLKLNGWIDCETAPGEGTSFTVTIPKDTRSILKDYD